MIDWLINDLISDLLNWLVSEWVSEWVIAWHLTHLSEWVIDCLTFDSFILILGSLEDDQKFFLEKSTSQLIPSKKYTIKICAGVYNVPLIFVVFFSCPIFKHCLKIKLKCFATFFSFLIQIHLSPYFLSFLFPITIFLSFSYFYSMVITFVKLGKNIMKGKK